VDLQLMQVRNGLVEPGFDLVTQSGVA
jgi:hypothetical protein